LELVDVAQGLLVVVLILFLLPLLKVVVAELIQVVRQQPEWLALILAMVAVMVVLVELALLRVLMLLAAAAVLADILALAEKVGMLVHRVLRVVAVQGGPQAVVVVIYITVAAM
jgi:hypothetical protein